MLSGIHKVNRPAGALRGPGGLAMSSVIKMLPGLIGALCAYISLKVLILLGFGSIEVEIMVFFLVYIAAAALAHKAMARYGTAAN